MKLVLFSLIATATAALAADSPSLGGKYQVHNSIAGNESDMACTLTQKDSDLTGSCTSDRSTGNISGKVDNKTVNWTYKSEYNGGPITLTYKGTLTADNKISGSVNVEEYSVEGEFTATPTK